MIKPLKEREDRRSIVRPALAAASPSYSADLDQENNGQTPSKSVKIAGQSSMFFASLRQIRKALIDTSNSCKPTLAALRLVGHVCAPRVPSAMSKGKCHHPFDNVEEM